MPDLVEGTDAAGTLRPELAARWGMGPGVVVAGGAGDNAASACGMPDVMLVVVVVLIVLVQLVQSAGDRMARRFDKRSRKT